MKEMRLSMRLVAILLAACVLATGAAFVVTVYVNGTRWINRANNTRLADAKKTTVQGSIYDAAGLELAAAARRASGTTFRTRRRAGRFRTRWATRRT